MNLPYIVLTPNQSKELRGKHAKEMLVCPKCGEQLGTCISTLKKDISFRGSNDIVAVKRVWERYACLGCRNVWVEHFGISKGNLFKQFLGN